MKERDILAAEAMQLVKKHQQKKNPEFSSSCIPNSWQSRHKTFSISIFF
jgi:hypothetical protein